MYNVYFYAMRKSRIQVFGIDDAGIIPQIENLFVVSSIDNTNYQLLYKVILPQRLDGAMLCICEQGNMEIMINSKVYNVTTNDMFVILPEFVFQLLSASEDFKIYIIGTNIDFITNARIASSVSIFLYIREHPCISIDKEDKRIVIELSQMLKVKSERTPNPYLKEISQSLLLALLYEISSIYRRKEPIDQSPIKRNDELLLQFIQIIRENCTKDRELKFYASKMCITPKHLSYVVLSASGVAATKWISEAVIIYAKSLLKSKMTVSQISDYLNFPNPSFFCQYFKKHTGTTPKSLQSSL